ncbi:hypothetical protein IAD21_02421 [Abditibacteriota bacterium]|nr:hypothetical protein IAD21_02421 [Abditibacteriota bacterium]
MERKKPVGDYQLEDFPTAITLLWRALDATEKVERLLLPPDIPSDIAPEKRSQLRLAVNGQAFTIWETLRDALRAHEINPREGEERLNELRISEAEQHNADWRETYLLEVLELMSDFFLLPTYENSWKIERALESAFSHLRDTGWQGSDNDVFEAFEPGHPMHDEVCAALSTKEGLKIIDSVESALDRFFACYNPRPHWETVLGALEA